MQPALCRWDKWQQQQGHIMHARSRVLGRPVLGSMASSDSVSTAIGGGVVGVDSELDGGAGRGSGSSSRGLSCPRGA